MDFSLSAHAKEHIRDHGLDLQTISLIIKHPDAVQKESDCKQIFQKIIGEKGSKYLYRIFVKGLMKQTTILSHYRI